MLGGKSVPDSVDRRVGVGDGAYRTKPSSKIAQRRGRRRAVRRVISTRSGGPSSSV